MLRSLDRYSTKLPLLFLPYSSGLKRYKALSVDSKLVALKYRSETDLITQSASVSVLCFVCAVYGF